MLWNPSLRKSFILPNLTVSSDSRFTKKQYIGFGLVPTSNEYKILRLAYTMAYKTGSETTSEAQIYELGTGSWRNLKLDGFPYLVINSPQAHLNGVLHWHAQDHDQSNPSLSSFICSFDMKTENFGFLMLPSCLLRDKNQLITSTYRESLSLINTTEERYFEIWVMMEYGVVKSWEKLFIIDLNYHHARNGPNGLSIPYFKHNGDLLFGKLSETHTGKPAGLVYYEYDCSDSRFKDGAFFVHSWVDSLVLIKGPSEVKIDSESTEISKSVRFATDRIERM